MKLSSWCFSLLFFISQNHLAHSKFCIHGGMHVKLAVFAEIENDLRKFLFVCNTQFVLSFCCAVSVTHCHWLLHYSFIFVSAVFHKNVEAENKIGFPLHDKLRIQYRLKSTYDPIVWQCLFDYHFCNKSMIFTRSSTRGPRASVDEVPMKFVFFNYFKSEGLPFDLVIWPLWHRLWMLHECSDFQLICLQLEPSPLHTHFNSFDISNHFTQISLF